MRGLKPGDEPRSLRRIDFAKTDEGGHLVPVAPHCALHVLKPAHQRVAGDLQEARRLPKSQESCIKQIIAGRLTMSANQVGQVKKTGWHAQQRDRRRGLGRLLLREKVVFFLRAPGHKTDCVGPHSARRGRTRDSTKTFEINLAFQANDLHGAVPGSREKIELAWPATCKLSRRRTRVDEVGWPPVGREDERAHCVYRADETGEIADPQRDVSPRSQDTLDIPGSQTWRAQERLARSAVDVDRKESPVAQSPSELRVALEVEHAIARATDDLLRREAVIAHQPVGFIKTMLAHQRWRTKR